jgi:antitoxin PrlF
LAEKLLATITSKGQITLPIELRRHWGLKAGDQVAFDPPGINAGKIEPRRRRSIFESVETLPPLSLGRPLKQEDIDDAVAGAMHEKYLRSKSGKLK